MAKVFFGWELGGGSGHIHILGPLALALRERGHQVTLASRDVTAADPLLGQAGIRIVPAPYWSGRVGGLPPSASFPEVLLRVGYLDVPVVKAQVRAWISLFDLCEADVVIVEHAPTALLAARASGRPAIVMGTGFSAPPPISPMPTLEPWRKPEQRRLAQAEKLVLDCMNAVLAEHERAPLDHVGDLFGASPNLLCTVAELDHYQPFRGPAEYLGPMSFEGQHEAPRWPMGEGAKVFAYMHPGYPQFEWVVKALAATGLPTLFVAPGVRPKNIRDAATARLKLSPTPVDIDAAAAAADFVVSHSPHGTLWNVLRHGTPQLLIPTYVEQASLAFNFARAGAALVLGAKENQEQFKVAVERLLSEPSYKAAAARLAARYGEWRLEERVAVLCERVEAAL